MGEMTIYIRTIGNAILIASTKLPWLHCRGCQNSTSFKFDPRDMLTLAIGFSFVRVAEACVLLQRTSGFEPSSETIALRNVKLLSFYFDLDLHVIDAVIINLFLSVLISI